MKLNKTLIIAAFAVGGLFAGSVAQAQNETSTNTPAAPAVGGGMRGGNRGMALDNLAKQLDLSADQKTQVAPILEGMQKQMQDLREQTDLSQTDRRAKIKEIRDGVTEKLKTVLTPEQLTKWEQLSTRNRRPGATPPTTTSTNTPPQQ